jgi:hypothetical protein
MDTAGQTVKCQAHLPLSPLMLHICGVSKKFGDWYQKTNEKEDTNKLNLLAFKIIILHNTLLAMFIKLLETVRKGLFRNRLQNRCHTFVDCRRADIFQKLYERCQPGVVKDDDYFEGQ